MSKPTPTAVGASGGTETVKVMVRVRPMDKKEKARGKYNHYSALSENFKHHNYNKGTNSETIYYVF